MRDDATWAYHFSRCALNPPQRLEGLSLTEKILVKNPFQQRWQRLVRATVVWCAVSQCPLVRPAVGFDERAASVGVRATLSLKPRSCLLVLGAPILAETAGNGTAETSSSRALNDGAPSRNVYAFQPPSDPSGSSAQTALVRPPLDETGCFNRRLRSNTLLLGQSSSSKSVENRNGRLSQIPTRQ